MSIRFKNRYWFAFSFFSNPATTEIYTLSLHDALPILAKDFGFASHDPVKKRCRSASVLQIALRHLLDRKSTRLNSSHQIISYAVFCLKKKKKPTNLGFQLTTPLRPPRRLPRLAC